MNKSTEQQLITEFLDTLQRLPGVHAALGQLESTIAGGYQCDGQVDLLVEGKSYILLIEAKKAVYPRDVRELLWRFREYNRAWEKTKGVEPLSILIAESMSPGAKELLRDESVGYYESGGSLFLPASGAYIYIDKPSSKSATKSIKSLFSGRRSQVIHSLLVHHQDWFGVKDLAEQAMVSSATVSEVATELERFDWLESRGQGPNKERRLREPGSLLDEWAKQFASINPQVMRRFYVPSMKANKLMERVDEVFERRGVKYAISYEAAAQCYTPFLSGISQVHSRVLMSAITESSIAELGGHAVFEGSNLTIIETESPGELLFRERIEGVWLASAIQVYLDLLHGAGRSKELAAHLRQERIGF